MMVSAEGDEIEAGGVATGPREGVNSTELTEMTGLIVVTEIEDSCAETDEMTEPGIGIDIDPTG